MEQNNLVRASIFCALAVGMGFSLMLVPNVELITVIVFLSGLTLSTGWGALVGITAIFIYSGLNPMGSGLSFPPLFIMQILGMAITGAVGGFVRPVLFKKEFNVAALIILALLGFTLTLIYDVFTLISYPISAGLGMTGVMAALVKGLGFTILHEISNAVVFVVAVPAVVKYLK
ncbi:MAG: hypothetical protein QF842_08175 [Candidatus Marinimicrobia bacterium]|jgi:hypothetical protein|nr:hypothetical protein [Candidatus Neomarinimicrobiota bacterium]MDP6610936.1 hypothetical protein [Candidatus Neomarinimicrobiota bacterium]|tara:strand:- start:56 stop:577 length:522 start_codon:yes stop_codon:yes gene_type:complete